MRAVISIFIGGIISGIITWLVAWHYYKKAGQELKTEATELRRLNKHMLHGMEHAGWIKLNRDKSGRILGFEQIIKPKSIESAAVVGNPTVTVTPSPQVISAIGIESAEEFGVAKVKASDE
jgi:hypothetical protein